MLNSSTINLRPIRTSDAKILLHWENDKANWLVSETTQEYSIEDMHQFVSQPQDIHANKQLRLMICLGEEPIGCIDLFQFDASKQQAGIGVLIANESNRGKGFATKALSQLKSFASNELNIVHLFCHIHPNNTASLRLFEKCGFKTIRNEELNGETVRYLEAVC